MLDHSVSLRGDLYELVASDVKQGAPPSKVTKEKQDRRGRAMIVPAIGPTNRGYKTNTDIFEKYLTRQFALQFTGFPGGIGMLRGGGDSLN